MKKTAVIFLAILLLALLYVIVGTATEAPMLDRQAVPYVAVTRGKAAGQLTQEGTIPPEQQPAITTKPEPRTPETWEYNIGVFTRPERSADARVPIGEDKITYTVDYTAGEGGKAYILMPDGMGAFSDIQIVTGNRDVITAALLDDKTIEVSLTESVSGNYLARVAYYHGASQHDVTIAFSDGTPKLYVRQAVNDRFSWLLQGSVLYGSELCDLSVDGKTPLTEYESLKVSGDIGTITYQAYDGRTIPVVDFSLARPETSGTIRATVDGQEYTLTVFVPFPTVWAYTTPEPARDSFLAQAAGEDGAHYIPFHYTENGRSFYIAVGNTYHPYDVSLDVPEKVPTGLTIEKVSDTTLLVTVSDDYTRTGDISLCVPETWPNGHTQTEVLFFRITGD